MAVSVLTGLLLPYLLYPVGGFFSGLSLGRRHGLRPRGLNRVLSVLRLLPGRVRGIRIHQRQTSLLMPHPAAVFLKKPGKCPCRIGLVFLFIVRNFTASVKKESDEFSLKGRLPSRRKFSAIKGKVPLGSPVGIIEEGWSVLDRFRREDA